MKTNKDYTVEFMNYGEITVPKGTLLTNMTAMGIDTNYHFVNDFKWITEKYPEISSILKHDLTYHGINVPKEYVEY